MIEEFDRQHVGAAQPAKAAPKPSATGRQAKALPADAAAAVAAAAQTEDTAQSQEAAAGTHVQVQTSAFVLLPDSFLLVGVFTRVYSGVLTTSPQALQMTSRHRG